MFKFLCLECVFWHPLPAKGGTPPINRGESAIRAIVALRKVSCTLYSVSCTLYSVLCTLASFLRNNLRRILPHHGAYVEGDDEEDDEGGKNDAEEDGHDWGDEVGRNEFLPTPVL